VYRQIHKMQSLDVSQNKMQSLPLPVKHKEQRGIRRPLGKAEGKEMGSFDRNTGWAPLGRWRLALTFPQGQQWTTPLVSFDSTCVPKPRTKPQEENIRLEGGSCRGKMSLSSFWSPSANVDPLLPHHLSLNTQFHVVLRSLLSCFTFQGFCGL